MKLLKIVAAAIVILPLISSCTINKIQQDSRTITVSSSGQVMVPNDQAVIELSVTTRGYDILKASSENAEKMQKVQQSLNQDGIANANISTSNYRIYQETNYQNGKSYQGQYNVSNQINVTIKDVEKAGGIIDHAIKAGANGLNNITYISTPANKENAVKQARLLAVKQAEEMASTLATSSGANLGKILKIEETSGNSYPRSGLNTNEAKLMATMDTTPVYQGNTVVTVSIEATYELY